MSPTTGAKLVELSVGSLEVLLVFGSVAVFNSPDLLDAGLTLVLSRLLLEAGQTDVVRVLASVWY